MTEQLTLDGKTQTEQELTDRQRFALELIRELGPIPSDELGAHMHERRGVHSTDIRCSWCKRAGREIGGTLRSKKTLGVKMKRGEGWVIAGKARKPHEGDYDPKTAPFPEGF